MTERTIRIYEDIELMHAVPFGNGIPIMLHGPQDRLRTRGAERLSRVRRTEH